MTVETRPTLGAKMVFDTFYRGGEISSDRQRTTRSFRWSELTGAIAVEVGSSMVSLETCSSDVLVLN